MAMYKEGQRYLRNRITGAVFQYRPEIARNANLVEMTANAEGELESLNKTPPKEVNKLNPTKTPEKKEEAKQTPTPQQTKQPTMTPVDK